MKKTLHLFHEKLALDDHKCKSRVRYGVRIKIGTIMKSLKKLPPSEVTIIFPFSENIAIQAMQFKCEALGVATNLEERPYTFYYSTNEDGHRNAVSEQEIKEWVNAMGEVDLFEDESSEDFENWQRLLLSKDSQNLIIALTILNTPLRPIPKYFTLWAVIAQLHSDKKVKETATFLILQYFTEEEWQAMYVNNLPSKYVYTHDPVTTFIDINFIFVWENLLLKRGKKKNSTLRISTKSIQQVIQHSLYQKTFPEMSSLCVKIDKKTNLSNLLFFKENFDSINHLYLYGNENYLIPENELPYLDFKYLQIKNCVFPTHLTKSLFLKNVRGVTIIDDGELNFLGNLFPNMVTLEIQNAKIVRLEIEENLEKLTCFSLGGTTNDILPDIIFKCHNLEYISLINLNLSELNPLIKQLTKLENMNFLETKIASFPYELFDLKSIKTISNLKPIKDYPQEFSWKKPTKLIFNNKFYTTFPYQFHKLQPLQILEFHHCQLEEIGDKITQFETLTELTFMHHQFKEIPNSLMLLPKLEKLNFSNGEIKSLSFEWILHIYEKNIELNLTENLINRLPPVPAIAEKYLFELRKSSNGKIRLTEGQISIEQITAYQLFYGKSFLVFE